MAKGFSQEWTGSRIRSLGETWCWRIRRRSQGCFDCDRSGNLKRQWLGDLWAVHRSIRRGVPQGHAAGGESQEERDSPVHGRALPVSSRRRSCPYWSCGSVGAWSIHSSLCEGLGCVRAQRVNRTGRKANSKANTPSREGSEAWSEEEASSKGRGRRTPWEESSKEKKREWKRPWRTKRGATSWKQGACVAAGKSEADPVGSAEHSRHRLGRQRGRLCWWTWRRRRGLQLCGGPDGGDCSPVGDKEVERWGAFEPQEVNVGLEGSFSRGGHKRNYFEKIEEEQFWWSPRTEASCSTTAGSCGRAGRKFERKEESEEEKRSRAWKKGKGWGGSRLPQEEKRGEKEEEAEEGKERKRKEEEKEEAWRKQQRIIELGVRQQLSQQRELVRIQQPASSIAEEESRRTRSSSANVGEACPRDLGPISLGGHRGEQGHHQRSQTELLLLSDAEALLLNKQPGHEGTLPLSQLCGSAPVRPIGPARRQPSVEIPGDPLCYGGRDVEECTVLGAESARCPNFCPSACVAGSEAACEADLQEPVEQRGTQKNQRVGMARRRMAEGKEQRKRKRTWQRKEGKRPWKLGQLARKLMVGQQQGQQGWQGCKRWERRSGEEVRKSEESESKRQASGEEPVWSTGFSDLEELVSAGSSLRKLGIGLAWYLIHAEEESISKLAGYPLLALLRGRFGLGAGMVAVHRSKDALPMRLGKTSLLVEAVIGSSFTLCQEDDFVSQWCDLAWLYNSIRFLNHLWGCPAAIPGRWRAHERVAVVSLQGAIARTLGHDVDLARKPKEVEKELSDRYLSYSGDEVPKMEVLSFRQAVAALPDSDRGGSIDVLDWVDGRTRTFLERPEDCVVDANDFKGKKLQAKVHICSEDRIPLALELVRRNVCGWVEESDIFTFNGERVLNGMFGVRKDSCLPDGAPVLRTIMNLIPSNSIMSQLRGMVAELPGMCQYCSIVLEDGETLALHQSDMTSAFYLFRLPPQWKRFLCFNLAVKGAEIGLEKNKTYYLAAAVLPMGWGSAVAVMQEVSSKLLLDYGLDRGSQVTRLKPLPPWLVHDIDVSYQAKQGWWHVYLDNFFAGEKRRKGISTGAAAEFHEDAEAAWAKGGVVSSAKKKVVGESGVQELGAVIDGDTQYLGMSGARLVKLCQTTLYVISQRSLNRKWLQVICGRWVHVLQYRRPGMSVLHEVWQVISNKRLKPAGLIRARFELLQCILGVCLLHTSLRAGISKVATASDASNKGGAVGSSEELTPVGRSFCRSLQDNNPGLVRARVIVLSLFNGIGGCFRTYDVLGVEVEALIGFDTCKASNRVCSRRWPQASLYEDVRSIDEAFIKKLLFLYPHATCIHLWAGFPCTDLSSVKAGRANLQGPQSSLFFEVLRIKALITKIFGPDFTLLFFVENVASMDKSAVKEISAHLGCIPYKVQCAQAVPISRPRYCWTNVVVPNLPGLLLRTGDGFMEVVAAAPWPSDEQWITPGFWWDKQEEDTIFPTAMKAIKRSHPPPQPAGIERCDFETKLRWRADQFRYPPYQYKSQYILYSEDSWRLTNASERELLHGYGWGHTALCLSASDIKRDQRAYEDLRCSLLGDSFSIYSFIIFPWAALSSVLPAVGYWHLANRMGMAPGFAAPLQFSCPLRRSLSYGYPEVQGVTVGDLTRCFLARTNHTGSDVRVTTGQILVPKAFPRQSAAADWWKWEGVFACRWSRKDHINSLELRAILLSLKHRAQRLKEADIRFTHLSDSYVCISILSKGRTGSLMLRPLLRKVSAWVLCFNLYMLLVHVESTENPTDAASRN